MTIDDEGICHGGGSHGVLRRAVVVAVVLLASGCASTGRGELDQGSRGGFTRIEGDATVYKFDLTTDRTVVHHHIRATPSAAWAALPGVYREIGLQGEVVDAARRVFGVPQRRGVPGQLLGQPLSRFLSCGSGLTSSADTYQVQLLALTQIDSTAQGTIVLTRLDAMARPRDVSSIPISCTTTGRLEGLLADSVEARAARASLP